MDPIACLLAALRAYQDGDKPKARTHISDYRAWRAGGGFEPEINILGVAGLPGDGFANNLVAYLDH